MMITNVHQQLILLIRCVLTDFLKAELIEIDLIALGKLDQSIIAL